MTVIDNSTCKEPSGGKVGGDNTELFCIESEEFLVMQASIMHL